MKRTDSGVLVGLLLVAVGVLFLLQSWLWSANFWGVIWAVVFGAIGLTFVGTFVRDPHQAWWAVIPGFTLLGLATIVAISSLAPSLDGAGWLGTIFLGSIGLAFWVIYAVRQDQWWAIIPGGVLATLAIVALLPSWFDGRISGAVFFFGLAATFALLFALPTPHGRMAWAWIPALVLGALGVIVLLSFGEAVNYIWPAILILTGLYMLLRQGGRGQMARHS